MSLACSRGWIARLLTALTLVLGFGLSAATAQAAPLAGINAHLMWTEVDAADLDRQLDWVQEAGADVVRVDVGWASLQEHAGDRYSQWYVERLDRMMQAARDHDVKLLVSFAYAPCWASSAPETMKMGCEGAWWTRKVQYYPPSDAAAYGNALAYLIERYGDAVAAWEVWNEPNSQSYLKGPDPARSYAQLVRAAYAAGKGADPSATILAGAISESNLEFVEQLYANGIAGRFDGFSVHPYTGDYSPLEPLPGYTKSSFVTGLPALHDLLIRRGDGDKPLWLTETGWSTSNVRGGEHWENGVDEATQAEYLRQAFAQAQQWDWVAAITWYSLRDTSDDPSDTWGNAGLRRVDGSARPAFAAFVEAAAALHAGGGPPAAPSRAQAPGPAANRTPAAAPGRAADGAGTAARRRLRLHFHRRGTRVIVRGRAPRGSRVRLRFTPASRASRAGRPPIRAARVFRIASYRRNGSFRRTLPRRFTRRSWMVTATVPGTRFAVKRLLRRGARR